MNDTSRAMVSSLKSRFSLYRLMAVVLFSASAILAALAVSEAGPFAPPAPQIESPVVKTQGLFELLFGRRDRSRQRSRSRTRFAPPANVGGDRRVRTRRGPATRSANVGAPSTPQPDPAAKLENAKRVVVIGDAMASGLSKGLEALFASTNNVVIVNRAKPGSGIVRHDYYDWMAEFPAILNDENPAAVVVMMGSNDRQNIRGSNGAEFRTEKWLNLYESRVQNLLDQMAGRNIPIVWVGMPIMRSSTYGRDISFLNDLFANQTNRVAAVFVESWNRFADADGKYNSNGPDVNGRIKRMRNNNGIHLTREGNLKLAYFVEQELRPLLGSDGPSQQFNVALNVAPPADEGQRSLIGVEISLTAPEVTVGNESLTGAGPILTGQDGGAAGSRLAELGTSPVPLSGRVDDFSWPPPAEESGTPDTPPL